MVSNSEKKQVWQAYKGGKPFRVPVTLGSNPRVVALDPRWNPDGVTFEEYTNDAAATVKVQLRYIEYLADYLNQFCDSPTGAPEEFSFYVDNQNVYDAAYFGCPVEFREGQVSDATPILTGADKERVFSLDVDHPLANPFVRSLLARYEALKKEVARLPEGKTRYKVTPPMLGFDGPLTIAVCLRGTELFCDIYEDPPYVRRLLEFIQSAVIVRNRALGKLLGVDPFEPFQEAQGWLADDSVQLISTDMYRDLVLPLHRTWYAHFTCPGPHFIHLCGDSTRHFPTLVKELNVKSFDTGFPVDHGALRTQLGPDVEIFGGPEIALMAGGTPQQVYERTKAILTSGIKRGGRFVLREGNNLPPCCPEANLAAFYRAALEFGRHDD